MNLILLIIFVFIYFLISLIQQILWKKLGFNKSFIVAATLHYISYIVIGLIFLGNQAAIVISLSVFALFFEYAFNFYYHLLQKHRLYSYADNAFDFRKYSHLFNIGYYAGGILMFLTISKIFASQLVSSNLTDFDRDILSFLLLSFLSLIVLPICFTSFINLDKRKLDHKLNIKKYIIFILIPIIALVSFLMTLNEQWLNVFLIGIIFGSIGEAVLGNTIHMFNSRYKHWNYYDLPILNKQTSLLISPLWGLASILVIITFKLVS